MAPGSPPIHRARPRISVLLPIRDGLPHLKEALASLERQTFGDFEIVAVDDGSTDGSSRVLEKWTRRDSRLRVIRQDRVGVVEALEAARGHARGPYLARIDADDQAHPERLEVQLRRLEGEPSLAAVGSRVRFFPRTGLGAGTRRYEAWINGLIAPDEVTRDLFVECPLAHPAMLLRADAVAEVGGYRDPGWPEDYDLVLRLWRGGWPLANEPRTLLHWRQHPQRLSRTDPRYGLAAFRRCKVHHLRGSLLVDGRDVVLCGAGPTGKAFARELQRSGSSLRAFVDVDPRKIGQEIHGAPVLPPGELASLSDAFLVGAVSGAGPRKEIRTAAAAAGRRELEDFVVVA